MDSKIFLERLFPYHGVFSIDNLISRSDGDNSVTFSDDSIRITCDHYPRHHGEPLLDPVSLKPGFESVTWPRSMLILGFYCPSFDDVNFLPSLALRVSAHLFVWKRPVWKLVHESHLVYRRSISGISEYTLSHVPSAAICYEGRCSTFGSIPAKFPIITSVELEDFFDSISSGPGAYETVSGNYTDTMLYFPDRLACRDTRCSDLEPGYYIIPYHANAYCYGPAERVSDPFNISEDEKVTFAESVQVEGTALIESMAHDIIFEPPYSATTLLGSIRLFEHNVSVSDTLLDPIYLLPQYRACALECHDYAGYLCIYCECEEGKIWIDGEGCVTPAPDGYTKDPDFNDIPNCSLPGGGSRTPGWYFHLCYKGGAISPPVRFWAPVDNVLVGILLQALVDNFVEPFLDQFLQESLSYLVGKLLGATLGPTFIGFLAGTLAEELISELTIEIFLCPCPPEAPIWSDPCQICHPACPPGSYWDESLCQCIDDETPDPYPLPPGTRVNPDGLIECNTI